jgi:hypothetical protein
MMANDYYVVRHSTLYVVLRRMLSRSRPYEGVHLAAFC